MRKKTKQTTCNTKKRLQNTFGSLLEALGLVNEGKDLRKLLFNNADDEVEQGDLVVRCLGVHELVHAGELESESSTTGGRSVHVVAEHEHDFQDP